MKGLFVRVFLSFWLAALLAGGVTVIIAFTTTGDRFNNSEKVVAFGREMIAAYEGGGTKALGELTRKREGSDQQKVYLFHSQNGPLSEPFPDNRSLRNVGLAAKPAKGESKTDSSRIWVSLPLEGDYRLALSLPGDSFDDYHATSFPLIMKLVMVFGITALVCYLLTRYLVKPIEELRGAARIVTEGDLSVRIGGKSVNRGDEIGELAHDFNIMAERVGILLESQSRLLRDVSHELRSPLARINVALGKARQEAGPDAPVSLDRIEQEAEQLNELIGQVLMLSRLESGSPSIQPSDVDLAEIVSFVASNAAFEAKPRNIEVKIVEAASVNVQGYPELLHSAIENVLRNAVKYTHDNKDVEIGLKVVETESVTFARCVVRDNGPGVPDDALDKLFTPFYRVDNSRDMAIGGTGIGLAITERAVRLHGGSVVARNHPDGGLEVRIEVPCLLSDK